MQRQVTDGIKRLTSIDITITYGFSISWCVTVLRREIIAAVGDPVGLKAYYYYCWWLSYVRFYCNINEATCRQTADKWSIVLWMVLAYVDRHQYCCTQVPWIPVFAIITLTSTLLRRRKQATDMILVRNFVVTSLCLFLLYFTHGFVVNSIGHCVAQYWSPSKLICVCWRQ